MLCIYTDLFIDLNVAILEHSSVDQVAMLWLIIKKEFKVLC